MVQMTITAGRPSDPEMSIFPRAGPVVSVTAVESNVEMAIGVRGGGA